MTIQDIIARNKAAGQFFFSNDTMAFFRSEVCDWVFEDEKYAYFGTSDVMGPEGSKRDYGVRIMEKSSGSIWSAYPSLRYTTERKARLAAMALAQQTPMVTEGDEAIGDAQK